MKCQWLYTVLSVTIIAVEVSSECTEEQLNAAKMGFKDCMDEKKETLLQTDVEGDEVQDLICSGLKDLSTGCKEAVNKFAICRGREFVDNLVAIHLNAMSEVLGPFYPTVNLASCPVFSTPAPKVVHIHHRDDLQAEPEPEVEPEYQPVTGEAVCHLPTWILLVAAAFQHTMWSS